MATNFYQKKNNAFSTLLSAITSGATSLQIQVADESKFPATGNFPITVFYAANNIATSEIMLVTAVSGNTFTVTRAQENTGAQAFDPGVGTVNVWLNDTAGGQQQQDTAINTLENTVAGITGAWTAWTPAFGGFSVAPTFSSPGGAYYIQNGKTVIAQFAYTVQGTSNANNFTITLPVAPLLTGVLPVTRVRDNGSYVSTCPVMAVTAGSTTATLFINATGSPAWTTSGGKACDFTVTYQSQ